MVDYGMSTWEKESVKECSTCGKKWLIEYREEIFRDSEEFYCDCGELIFSYSGAASYRVTPVDSN